MTLWVLERQVPHHDWWYEQYISMLVYAPDEAEARKLAAAQEQKKAERSTMVDYLDPAKTTCTPLVLGDIPRFIEGSFNNA